MAWTKMKTAIVAGVGILLIGGTTIITINEFVFAKVPVYETEIAENYGAFHLVWDKSRQTVSGPFLHQQRPASRDGWDAGFQVGAYTLGWSIGGMNGDWIYMNNPLPPSEPRWEFALSNRKNLKDVKRTDWQRDFYGMNDPKGATVFGTNWAGHAIRVPVGQIFFARLVADPSTVYVVQLAKKEVSANRNWGAMLARYIVEGSLQMQDGSSKVMESVLNTTNINGRLFYQFSFVNRDGEPIRWRGNWSEVEGVPYKLAAIENRNRPFDFTTELLQPGDSQTVFVGAPTEPGNWKFCVSFTPDATTNAWDGLTNIFVTKSRWLGRNR